MTRNTDPGRRLPTQKPGWGPLSAAVRMAIATCQDLQENAGMIALPSATQQDYRWHLQRSARGVRAFFPILEQCPDPGIWTVNPFEFVLAPSAADLIERLGRNDSVLAERLALGRLLLSELRSSRAGRHLIAEATGTAELSGDVFRTMRKSPLAQGLAVVQQDAWEAAKGGRAQAAPLEDLFWQSHVELPHLPDMFEDPDLDRFASRLYDHLCEHAEDGALVELDGPDIRRRLARLARNGFQELGLAMPKRRARQLWKKLLAVTVRLTSQLLGQLVKDSIRQALRAAHARGGGQTNLEVIGPAELSPDEEALIDLNYGACRELGDVSVAFLGGCGDELAERLSALAAAIWARDPERRAQAEDDLVRYVDLRRKFLKNRKDLRAVTRREVRQRYATPLPRARQQAQDQPDRRASTPLDNLAYEEDRTLFMQALSRLKPRDRERVEAMLATNSSFKHAAEQLGLPVGRFRRKWRETTQPNLRRASADLR